jgi:hypothetical protein
VDRKEPEQFPPPPSTWASGLPIWWSDSEDEMQYIVLTIGRRMYDGTYQCSLPEFVKDDVDSLFTVTDRIKEFARRRQQ